MYDPEPDSAVKGPWRTFRRLLELTPPEASHRFQIQDDGLPCRNLRHAVEAAVAAQPDRLLVFFVGVEPRAHSRRVIGACDRDLPWAELPPAQWCPAVATCWPVALIGELLRYVDEQDWRDSFFSDDERIGRFLTASGHRALASVPSLVEHPEDTPSLVGRRTGRHAACWIGACDDCDDATAIDWARGVY